MDEQPSIFPLRLSPFEEYMLLDDRPGYPMHFVCRLRFSGIPSHDIWQTSLNRAVTRHPLLCSRIERIARNVHQWRWVRDAAVPLHVDPPQTPEGFPQLSRIDLRSDSGVDAFIVRSDGHFDLHLRFHHACCDGQGAFQFVEDALLLYDATFRGEPAQLPTRTSHRLTARALYGMDQEKWLPFLARQIPAVPATFQFLTRKPVAVLDHAAPTNDIGLSEPYPAVLSHQASVETSTRLQAAAKAKGVTTYELCCRDLLSAMRQFRRQLHGCSDRNWYRLNIPVSLRTAADADIPAANIVSMMFFECRGAQADQPDRLLLSIRSELSRLKRLQLTKTFVTSARVFHSVPGMFDVISRSRRCLSTCVFTNLGRPLDHVPLPLSDTGKLITGDCELLMTDVLAPIRPLTAAAFSMNRYAGQISLLLNYDGHVMTADQATELMSLFTERLRRSSQEANLLPS